MLAARRRDHRRRAGGTVHAEEALRRIPERSDSLLPARGRHLARRPAIHRFLRQAPGEVRATAGDVSRVRSARAPIVRDGDADLVEGEAVPEAAAPDRAIGADRWLEEVGAAPGPRRRRGSAAGTSLHRSGRSHSRTRSVSCTRRSPTTRASRSTPESTRSWAWLPTASRSTSRTSTTI